MSLRPGFALFYPFRQLVPEKQQADGSAYLIVKPASIDCQLLDLRCSVKAKMPCQGPRSAMEKSCIGPPGNGCSHSRLMVAQAISDSTLPNVSGNVLPSFPNFLEMAFWSARWWLRKCLWT